MIREKRRKICEVFLFTAILMVTGLIVYTNLFHYCYKMNADIASEAVLAQLIWESGEWVPKSWYNGTEVRILFPANLAALFYGIFCNAAFAMGCACSIYSLGILGSLYFFVSQFSFRREEKLLFLLLCLIISNNFVMLELFYLFASYYAIHIILLFLTLGIYVRLLDGVRVHRVWQALFIIFSFTIGMQGVRGILVLNVPMFVTEVTRQIYLWYSKEWKMRDGYIAGWCALLLFAGYAGTFTPYSVEQRVSRNIRKGFGKLWKTVLPEVFEAFGVAETSDIRRGILVFFLLIAIGVLIGCLLRILKMQGAELFDWANVLLWMSLGASIMAVAFTTTETSARYYFAILPLVAFGFVRFVHSVREKHWLFRAVIAAMVVFLLFSHICEIYLPILRSEEPTPSAEYEVCRYLKENDYEIVYANFDKGNTITILSGGEVRGAAVASFKTMNICRWLSSEEWYAPNMPYRQRTAYVVSETDKAVFNQFLTLHPEEIRLKTKIGYLYIYESDYNLSSLDYN